jgi:hypothetical protein
MVRPRGEFKPVSPTDFQLRVVKPSLSPVESVYELVPRAKLFTRVPVVQTLRYRAIVIDDLTCFGFSPPPRLEDFLALLASDFWCYGRGHAGLEQWLRSVWEQVLDNGLSYRDVFDFAWENRSAIPYLSHGVDKFTGVWGLVYKKWLSFLRSKNASKEGEV